MTAKQFVRMIVLVAAVQATLSFVCIAAFSDPPPKPRFLPSPAFTQAEPPQGVEDLGFRDAIRILRLCRAATADIPLPTTQAEVDTYVDRCTPLCVEIIKREMKKEFPRQATTKATKPEASEPAAGAACDSCGEYSTGRRRWFRR